MGYICIYILGGRYQYETDNVQCSRTLFHLNDVTLSPSWHPTFDIKQHDIVLQSIGIRSHEVRVIYVIVITHHRFLGVDFLFFFYLIFVSIIDKKPGFAGHTQSAVRLPTVCETREARYQLVITDSANIKCCYHNCLMSKWRCRIYTIIPQVVGSSLNAVVTDPRIISIVKTEQHRPDFDPVVTISNMVEH